MACCKPCCGCQDCSPGQQGKCCCGGATGECCQADEYCCNGACQSGPCVQCCEEICHGPEDCQNEDCGCIGYSEAGPGQCNSGSLGGCCAPQCIAPCCPVVLTVTQSACDEAAASSDEYPVTFPDESCLSNIIAVAVHCCDGTTETRHVRVWATCGLQTTSDCSGPSPCGVGCQYELIDVANPCTGAVTYCRQFSYSIEERPPETDGPGERCGVVQSESSCLEPTCSKCLSATPTTCGSRTYVQNTFHSGGPPCAGCEVDGPCGGGACCLPDGTCQDGLTQSACESQGGTFHPGQTCAEEPCSDGCFERALLGDEAYVDGWCANAASSVGFAGQPCELTTATCGARTLVNEYAPGFGDWIVTVCCDNPLP